MDEKETTLEPAKAKKEISLTDENWLFLKYLRTGATIAESYKLAGYKGEGLNAPYALYHQIKKKLEEVVKADGFDKLRLSLDFQKVLSLPLVSDKQEVTMTEWLKIRRLAHTIMSENEQKTPQAQFTMIVIESGQPSNLVADKMKDIIDIQPLDGVDDKANDH